MSARTANCPNCGAEIVFRWSGAVQTSCPACRSVLVRHDLDLERVGEVGDVPPSMSRIQLGTEGQYNGKSFVVVGRIIYKYGRGHWSEWHLRLTDDTSAWLSDAQAEYAITRQVESPPHLDRIGELRPGERSRIANVEYTLTSRTRASYAGVEGELPFEYWDKSEVSFVDLRTDSGGFGTIDFSETPAVLFLGEVVDFDALHLKNLREDAEGASLASDATKGLNCAQCGAAIELRTGDLAQTVVCAACGAIVDMSDANYGMLVSVQSKQARVTPAIPLGAVGTLKGHQWQVVGFQVIGIEVDGVSYKWREYLLWNAERGFHYLSEYEGHWNEIGVAKGVPKQVVGGTQPVMEYLGTRFKHFQTATAVTYYVVGEFPWEVRTGDRVKSSDFVAPPLMLSSEATDDEVTWSLGTYTAPERIREAFALPKPLPPPRGMFANQPNPMGGRTRGMFAAFLALVTLLFVLFVGRLATARNERVFTGDYHFDETSVNRAFVTPVFPLKGRTSNVQVSLRSNISNDWAYFNFALLPDSGGNGFELGRELSDYRGVEDGESWHEGSRNEQVTLPSVPPGNYYLRVEPEREGPGAPFDYTLTVTRDVPRLLPFALIFIALIVPPIFTAIRSHTYEHRRWMESDHPPVTESDSDDDDE